MVEDKIFLTPHCDTKRVDVTHVPWRGTKKNAEGNLLRLSGPLLVSTGTHPTFTIVYVIDDSHIHQFWYTKIQFHHAILWCNSLIFCEKYMMTRTISPTLSLDMVT